jgi:glycosyltransferase involved in cell wall biosynthesis
VKLVEFNALMLLSDGFGGFGGISQFNRDFLSAVDKSGLVTRTLVFPRLIRERLDHDLPESLVYFRRSASGKSEYFWQLMRGLHLSANIHLIICGHIHLLPLAVLAAKIKRARLALIIHGIEAWQPTQYRLANNLVSRIDSLVSVSKLSAERFGGWSDIETEQAFILGNCVDLKRFVPTPPDKTLAARYGLEGHRVIMTLGRLANRERYKGFDEVIDVLPALVKDVPSVKYLIAGDGDDRRRLQAKVQKLGMQEYVVFAGKPSEEEKVAHYSLADAYVMPSSGEGFGIVLLEAAACGVPVIGSAIDGSKEALLGGALGQLVDPKDLDGLRHAIRDLLEARPARYRPSGIENFGVPAFDDRVRIWLESQMDAQDKKMLAA